MEELSLFDFPQVEINKPIRLIELFGGIGSQAMALRDIGANFEHYRLVEFDKYAVASYNAIHGTNFTTTDIRDVHGVDMGIVNRQEFTYLLTYSFPCTDLSVAGKMKGMSKADWENGKSTRSGLLWEVERILKECKKEELPQILLMENVPQVHAEQNMADFESWLAFLRSRGYHNHWQDLNAKDYGIPQNRDRCFCVSILSDEFIDFKFPKPVKLDTVMRDFLEDEVDEKYYIKSEKADKLIVELKEKKLLEQERNPNDKIYLGNYYGRHDGYDGSVFHPNGICKTITHSVGGVADVLEKEQLNPKVAKTLMARDSKGFNTGFDTQNGVIEIRQATKDAVNTRGANIVSTIRASYHKNGERNLIENIETEKGYEGVIEIKQATKEGTISERQNSIKAKRLPNGNIRFYRDDEKKSAVFELQVQSGADVAQTITVANVPKIYKEEQVEIKQATKEGTIKCKVGGCYDASFPDSKTRRGRVQDNGDTVPTLTASSSENINYVETVYRIRKLTPLECGRLMGYCDFDIEKTLSVNSNSQVYRQFGNAIVKQVLMAIFLQLGIEGLKKWNDRTPEEREKLVMGSVYDKEFE